MSTVIGAQVGHRIRHFRKRLGLTVDQLAERVGVSRQQIVRIEAGLSGVTLARLQRISEALGVILADLMPPPGEPPEDYLQIAFRGSGLTKEETDRVLEYARMLRLLRSHEEKD
ncbi:MAG: helix-turn-helix domain-containing protein [Clostridia bacterium]